ncbi:MAG: hypothetical protein IKU83_02025 [Lachnospiraceae bacterium]|nr:hypothetical protein [Lachnospiraceae bacterium]
MTKTKYPVEAFALAMILCTLTVSKAATTGILLILGTVAGMLARVILGEEKRMQEVELMTTFFAVFGVLYLVDLYVFGVTDTWQSIFAVAILAMMAAKHVWGMMEDECEDYKEVVKQSFVAYAVMLVIALFREALGAGTVLGYDLPEFSLISSGYTHTMFGFIFAGLGIAVVNWFFKMDAGDAEASLIIVPVAVLATPFAIDSIPNVLSIILAAFLVIIYLVSVKGRLIFSDVPNTFKGMPIELVAVGIVYMILSFF